jgi:Lrp/AsnC family leucine-responsive transcriptional regulator
MSPPSVAERIKRLERAGIIVGYRAEISMEALGLPITALVRLHLRNPDSDEFVRLISDAPEVLECVQVAEPKVFQVRASLRDVNHLRRFTSVLNGFGDTVTSLVLSHPVKSKIVDRTLRHAK